MIRTPFLAFLFPLPIPALLYEIKSGSRKAWWIGLPLKTNYKKCQKYQPWDYNLLRRYIFFSQGMGGQLNYFGLWLDENFGSGHSRGQPSCTTYGSPQLSSEEEFKIDRLEAWGVGVPPENLVSLCRLSLDSDSSNYNFIMFQMCGRFCSYLVAK